MEEVPKGAESIYILLEGSDPTVYAISQDADLDTDARPDPNVTISPAGTGRGLLTVGEVGAGVYYSDVFEEDSMVPVASQLNRQMEEALAEHVDKLFINADSDKTASTNINLIDDTPTTQYYTATDGARKLALITAPAASVTSARDGGAIDADDYRLTLKLMSSEIRSRRNGMLFIIDPDTETQSLDITEVKTQDVFSAATIEAGELRKIWGVDVASTGHLPLANSSGCVSTTGSNNTTGSILLVYAPYWAMGWKRKIKLEADKDIISGDNLIVAKMRLGFKYRSTKAATISYNLTVA